MQLPAFPVSGGCACGAVRYRLMAPPLSVYVCHCKRCQTYGGIGTVAVAVRRADVEIIGTAPVEHQEPADSGHNAQMFFCPRCHVRVWHGPAVPELLTLMGGTLDDPTWLEPVAHIFTRSKQAGVLTGDVPCFDGPAPSRETLFELFRRAAAPNHGADR